MTTPFCCYSFHGTSVQRGKVESGGQICDQKLLFSGLPFLSVCVYLKLYVYMLTSTRDSNVVSQTWNLITFKWLRTSTIFCKRISFRQSWIFWLVFIWLEMWMLIPMISARPRNPAKTEQKSIVINILEIIRTGDRAFLFIGPAPVWWLPWGSNSWKANNKGQSMQASEWDIANHPQCPPRASLFGRHCGREEFDTQLRAEMDKWRRKRGRNKRKKGI